MASLPRYLSIAVLALFGGLSRILAKDIAVNWLPGKSPQSISAKCGDKLVFKFGVNAASLVKIQQGDCMAKAVRGYGFAGPVTVPLNAAGVTYYKSTVDKQCTKDKMLLTVTTTCTTHVVTNAEGLNKWGAYGPAYPTVNAKCGDSVSFVWGPSTSFSHDVMMMTKDNYSNCTFDSGGIRSMAPKTTSGNFTLLLKLPSVRYFACSVGNHCARLQKVTVITAC